jgi:WD40 repeat protein
MRRFLTDDYNHFCTPGIAFSPDGRYLGYVQCDDFACLWNVKNGEQVAIFIGDRRHPFALCQFTPDGKEFILDDEKRVSFWDVRANKETRSVRIERVPLLSPDARTWLCFGEKHVLSLIDVQSGMETHRLEVSAARNGIENGIAFAPDGKTLALVHQNNEIQVRDFPGGKQRVSFPLPNSAKHRNANQDYWEYQLSFSTDGRTLLLGTRGGLVHRWDLATRKELPPLSKHRGAVAGVHTLPDGKTIVTTGADGLIRRWDRETGRELSEPPGYMGRTHAIYSSDGRYAVIGDARGRLELWDARNGQLLRILQREGPAITKLAFTPKGQLLATAHADNTVHFWPLPAGEEPRILRCDKEHDLAYVWNMRFSPDGRRLLIMDRNYRARLWELSSGSVCWKNAFGAAEFSPDGKTLAMVHVGPYLNLLDASNGKTRARLRLNTNTPERVGSAPAIAFSPDGQRLALGMNGVYVCDARTGAEIHHFQAADLPKGIHEIERRMLQKTGDGGVRGLAFSPDGRWLCTSGRDGSVRLWEVITGREVLRRDGHAGDVKQVAFGANSRTVLSCGEDAQAYLWSLRPSMEEAKTSLDSLWSALAAEPEKAYRAIWRMSENEGAGAFLRGKLAPVKPVTNERLARLIADLDSDQFAVREAATKALAALDSRAAPAMREALRNNPPLESRKRLEELIRLAETKTLSPEDLRIGRAIDVLERLATAEARTLLKVLAGGAPEALTTTAARAALKRLEQ